MTAVRLIRLWCDYRLPAEEGQYRLSCHKEFEPPTDLGFVSSMRVMRAAAAKEGWTYVPYPNRRVRDALDKDYCPEHKPAPPEGEQ